MLNVWSSVSDNVRVATSLAGFKISPWRIVLSKPANYNDSIFSNTVNSLLLEDNNKDRFCAPLVSLLRATSWRICQAAAGVDESLDQFSMAILMFL